MISIDWPLLMGIIGTITGVVSLAWHIWNFRPRISVDVEVVDGGFSKFQGRGTELVGLRVNYRNKGEKPVTVEDVKVYFNGEGPFFEGRFKPYRINANSSNSKEHTIIFEEEQYDKLLKSQEVDYRIEIKHTFSTIIKKGSKLFGDPDELYEVSQ